MRVISIIVCQGARTDPALHEGVPCSPIHRSLSTAISELSGFFLFNLLQKYMKRQAWSVKLTAAHASVGVFCCFRVSSQMVSGCTNACLLNPLIERGRVNERCWWSRFEPPSPNLPPTGLHRSPPFSSVAVSKINMKMGGVLTVRPSQSSVWGPFTGRVNGFVCVFL